MARSIVVQLKRILSDLGVTAILIPQLCVAGRVWRI